MLSVPQVCLATHRFFRFRRPVYIFAHRAAQVAWARDPISMCVRMNRDEVLLLEPGVLNPLGE